MLNKEALDPEHNFYKPQEQLATPPGYKFPDGLEWNVMPATCCFFYCNNDTLKDIYVKEYFRFTENNPTSNFVSEMIFAEQRLITMLIKKYKFTDSRLSRDFYHNHNNRSMINHTKQLDYSKDFFHFHLGTSYRKYYQDPKNELCTMMAKRLVKDFPRYKQVYTDIEPLSRYFKPVLRLK